MERILRGATAILSLALYDADGDPDTGLAITADITDSSGAAVQSGLSAPETPASSGIYQLTPTPITVLDTYDVTWDLPGSEVRQTEFEVVGAFLFALPELRAFDAAAGTASYSNAQLSVARERSEEFLEQVSHVAYRPRGRRAVLDGTNRDALLLLDPKPIRVVSATVDGTAFGQDELDELLMGMQRIRRPLGKFWNWGHGNVEILYEHGYASVPAPVREAAMKLAMMRLVKDSRPSRATSEVTEIGVFRLSTADPSRQRWTGYPDIDAVIAEFGIHVPI